MTGRNHRAMPPKWGREEERLGSSRRLDVSMSLFWQREERLKQSLRTLAQFVSILLAAAACCGRPAAAQIVTSNSGRICAVLVDNTGTRIEIADIGIAPRIWCHNFNPVEPPEPTICKEAFS